MCAAAFGVVVTAVVLAVAPGGPAGPAHPVANPSPLPVTETLIGEGITVEGPLVNNVTLPPLP
nr:hypothetical protein [Streptomyces luteocolor]